MTSAYLERPLAEVLALREMAARRIIPPLGAEIDRLRSALREIVEVGEGRSARIARAALMPPEPKS